MKLSISAGYGLITMMYIAQKGKMVLSQEIAEKCQIPSDYLLKVLQHLVRAGMLQSRRGPHGGFMLTRSLSEISFLDIIEAIDGSGEFQLGSHSEQINELANEIEKVCQKAISEFKNVLKKATLNQTLRILKTNSQSAKNSNNMSVC
jgi:Rrf2 family protein